MAEGIVKKCREFARSVQAKLNSYEYTILEKMSYSDWSTRNTNYNNPDMSATIDTLENDKNQLYAIEQKLVSLLEIVKKCQVEINNQIFSDDYVQLLKNAKMFDECSDYENNINSIEEDLSQLKNTINELYTLCTSRISEAQAAYSDICSVRGQIRTNKARLSEIYSIQSQKRDSDEIQRAGSGDDMDGGYEYKHDPSQTVYPSPLSVEEWWDFWPYGQ